MDEISNDKIKNWICECGRLQKKPIFFNSRRVWSCEKCNRKTKIEEIRSNEAYEINYLNCLSLGSKDNNLWYSTRP